MSTITDEQVRAAINAFTEFAGAYYPSMDQMRAALEAAEAAAWRPIEEAPKDGTPILVNFGSKGVNRVAWEETCCGLTIWAVDDWKHGPFALRGYLDEDIAGFRSLPSPPKATP